MNKEKLIRACEKIMVDRLKKDCSGHPHMGTLLENKLVHQSLINTSELCTAILEDLNHLENYRLSAEQIADIVQHSYFKIKSAYNHIDANLRAEQYFVHLN